MSESLTDLPIAALNAYLREQGVEIAAIQRADKFGEGQSNPTYLLTSADGKLVLRRKPPGVLLKSAHAVDREYRVMKALFATPVPVPRVIHLCEDPEIIGSDFYLMEYVEGRTFWDPRIPEVSSAERSAIYRQMNQLLANLHQEDPTALGLDDFGKPGNYFERQISRWSRQYRASQTETIAAMDTLMEWLPAHLPDDDVRVSLIHGDYRLDNLIFHPREPIIVAVIDWELSTLGNPLADLSYQCMQWRMPPDAEIKGLAGVDRAALGIPSESQYVSDYCRHIGIDGIDHWPFYLAYNFFRFAAILQGVAKRGLDGNASNQRALSLGKLVAPLARQGLSVLDLGERLA